MLNEVHVSNYIGEEEVEDEVEHEDEDGATTLPPVFCRVFVMMLYLVEVLFAMIILWSELRGALTWVRYAQYFMYFGLGHYGLECVMASAGVVNMVGWTPRDIIGHHLPCFIVSTIAYWQIFSDPSLFDSMASESLSLRLLLYAAWTTSFNEAFYIFRSFFPDPDAKCFEVVHPYIRWIILVQHILIGVSCSVLCSAHVYWPLYKATRSWIVIMQMLTLGLGAPAFHLFYQAPLVWGLSKKIGRRYGCCLKKTSTYSPVADAKTTYDKSAELTEKYDKLNDLPFSPAMGV